MALPTFRTEHPFVAPAFAEGDYLTDELRLYRVVRVLPSGKALRPAAILEDCVTLHPAAYEARELDEMGLRLVEPGGPPPAPPRAPRRMWAI